MTDNSPKFVVMVTGTTTMSVAEVWPDGNAPERPTAQDVADVMREQGKSEVVNGWALIEDCDVEVFGPSTYAIPFRGDQRIVDAERVSL